MVGMALLVVGGTLLLVTTGLITVGAVILPVFFLIGGVGLFGRAFLPDGKDSNVFTGTFLALSGGFALLWESALPAVQIAVVWPVFMTIVGIALTVYGVRKGEEYRLTLVTPGAAIIILSLVFLLFSTDVIEESLSRVAAKWWPLIVVFIGVLVIVYRRDRHDQDDNPDEEDLIPPVGDSDTHRR